MGARGEATALVQGSDDRTRPVQVKWVDSEMTQGHEMVMSSELSCQDQELGSGCVGVEGPPETPRKDVRKQLQHQLGER